MDEARRLAPQMPSPHLTARLPAAVWSLRSKPCTVELPEGFEARNEQLAKALAEAADAQVEAQNIMEAQRHLDLRIELEAAFGDADVFTSSPADATPPRMPNHTPAAASPPASGVAATSTAPW